MVILVRNQVDWLSFFIGKDFLLIIIIWLFFLVILFSLVLLFFLFILFSLVIIFSLLTLVFLILELIFFKQQLQILVQTIFGKAIIFRSELGIPSKLTCFQTIL